MWSPVVYILRVLMVEECGARVRRSGAGCNAMQCTLQHAGICIAGIRP